MDDANQYTKLSTPQNSDSATSTGCHDRGLDPAWMLPSAAMYVILRALPQPRWGAKPRGRCQNVTHATAAGGGEGGACAALD